MKRILSLLLLLAATMFTTALHAQGHFDWVRTYFGPDNSDGTPVNEVFGSVMDSAGNVYILGQFIRGAQWDDGSEIMPFSVQCNRGAVITKFSSNGNLLWHKELYSSYNDIFAYTIRMVGDTALMLCAMVTFPFDYGLPSERNELYYFDTLLTTSERFPESPDSLQTPERYYGFITLGLESGNIIEEHFLTLTYVKNDGSMLRSKYSDYLITNEIRVSFNVDNEGNIILARQANDLFREPCDTCPNGLYLWSPNEGNISTLRLIVDGAAKQMDVPIEHSSRWNWQIIKLSPHLDSVISSTYVFDSTWRYSEDENISLDLNSIEIDANDNIDMLFLRIQEPAERWPVKNSDSLALEWNSCLLRYNSELTPNSIAQVTGSYTPDGYYIAGGLTFLSTYYDSATESLFINGISGRRPQYSTINYRGDTLNLMNNACWLRLNANDFSLISYGKSRYTGQQGQRTYFHQDGTGGSAHTGSFMARDNRVFCQVKYKGNILFQNTRIDNHDGMGLFVWDYDGHELEYIDYNSPSSTNEQGYIFLKDSSLWLSGTITENADFGGIQVNAASNSHAYLAHYTDTSFMTPYVYKDTTGNGGDTNDVRIILPEEGNALVAYPNPFRQRVNIEYSGQQPITAAYLTDIMGRTEQVELSATAPGRYTLDLTARPQAVYLLTLVTQDGHRHTVRLLKQSEVFGQ